MARTSSSILRRLLGVVGLARPVVAAQEHGFFLLAVGEGTELLAHAPFAHHLAGDVRRTLDVVAGAGREATEDDLLGDAATERDGDAGLRLLLREAMAVVLREVPGDTQRGAARDDADLVDRVVVVDEDADEGVTGFVDGGVPLLLVADDHRAALGAHEDLVLRELEVDHADGVLVLTRGEQGGLVHEVLEVGAAEARRAACDRLHVHVDAEGRDQGCQ
jgi:hypothetical protein